MSLTTATAIAVIFLALHAIIIILLLMAVGFLSARTMIIVNRKAREVMPTVQQYARQMADGAETVSQRVSEPIVKAQTTSVRWQARWRRATAPLRSRASGSTDPASAATATGYADSQSQEG